jgi:predicted MFS family arabinose efflux permease
VRIPDGLRALHHRDFRVYYAGLLVAMTGTWMQNVAQAWLVLQLTNSPLLLGLIGTLQFAPILLFSVVTGAIADRVSKRRLLVTTLVTQSVLALTLAVLVGSGHARYWHVAAVAVIWGFAAALDQPARQSFVMELVGREDVMSAVGLASAAFNMARIVGPSVAGLLIGRAGIAPTFALNVLFFAVAIGALLSLERRRPVPRVTATTMIEEIVEGLGYALRTPRVRLLLGLLLIVSFCVFNFSIYVPLLARTVLGLGSEGFGLLMTALGVGAVAAGLSIGTVTGRQPSLVLAAIALSVACAGLLGLAAVGQVWTAAVLLVMVGFTATLVSAACNTSLQLLAPDRLRGRVMSVYTLVSGGVFPLGAFWVGAVSEARGVSTAFAVNGSLGLAGLGALLLWWRARPPGRLR